MNRLFEVKIADIPVVYNFRNRKTAKYFAGSIHLSNSETYDIMMNETEFQFFRNIHPIDVSDEYVEYKGLIDLTSKKLLNYNCCIFHAVSFIWKDKAWLLTGKSGIGKTTQFINWNRIYPNEISIISGDMPILDFRKKNILVHPSPWNGKERMRGLSSAELGGIIFLDQYDKNSIELTSKNDSIISLFHQFAVIPEKETEILIISNMIQRIIKDVQIWLFSNNGSDDSSRLLRNTILKYLERKNRIE